VAGPEWIDDDMLIGRAIDISEQVCA